MRKIDGKKLANKILNRLEKEIKTQKIISGLAVILAGKNPASHLYVENKKKAAEKIGVKFELYQYSANIANETLIMRVKMLNKRKDIHGIIVQLPLPKKLDTDKIIKAISPKKDVDGFHPKTRHVSPVAQAVTALLEATKRNLKNKRAVLFAKNKVFVKPIKKLLENKGMKVQIVLAPSLREIKKEAWEGDVIVTALGRPGILKDKIIKDGTIIIDVGFELKGETLKFMGDFDPVGSEKKKGFYTPVPGGVGPVTVALLLKNVVEASK